MPGTPAPTAPTTRAPLSAYLLMVAVGLALAAGLGTIASVLREQQPALTFAVFSMTLLPACLGVSWLIFVAGHTTAPPEHAEEGVETNWLQRATSGAFFDVITLLGLGLVAVAITGIELSVLPALAAVLFTAMADASVRYLVLSRREG
ncbi:MAG TPA: hypothetical protein VK063_10805 [Beutenbergiaceae bacterium]|nr:hypothetical protein [Beutenbergiaceae bacterium]